MKICSDIRSINYGSASEFGSSLMPSQCHVIKTCSASIRSIEVMPTSTSIRLSLTVRAPFEAPDLISVQPCFEDGTPHAPDNNSRGLELVGCVEISPGPMTQLVASIRAPAQLQVPIPWLTIMNASGVVSTHSSFRFRLQVGPKLLLNSPIQPIECGIIFRRRCFNNSSNDVSLGKSAWRHMTT